MKAAFSRFTRLQFGLFIFSALMGTHASGFVRYASAQTTTSPAGIYPMALRDNGLRSDLGWLGSLHQLLIEHFNATGQTLRFELMHEAVTTPKIALDRARERLIGLPVELRQRQSSCLIVGFYEENREGQFEIHAIDIECGLSLNHVTSDSSVRELFDSISGNRFSRKAWEAHLFWLGLELMRACESPVVDTDTLSENRLDQLPQSLKPLLQNWLSAQLEKGSDDHQAPFRLRPDFYGEDSEFDHWRTTLLETTFLLFALGASWGLFSLMLALRQPLLLISSSGSRKFVAREKLEIFWKVSFLGANLHRLKQSSRGTNELQPQDFEVIDV